MKKTVGQIDISHEKRKKEHLEICLNEEVQFREISTGFDNYYFIHQALPEIELAEIDLSVTLFGKFILAPIIVSPMVGGIETAIGINRNLAQAAQTLGLAMGVGSQRCLIDIPELGKTFQVRDIAPDILLFANLGAVQLNYEYGVQECLKMVRSIGADALILHLNPLQEALQPEGNTNFAGLVDKIRTVCCELPVPVIVKEVGAGISEETAKQLALAGVAGIDVAGAGGTSWSQIERIRTTTKVANNVAAAFAAWGIPTADSVIMARKGAPGLPIIASGGIRTGIDVAKAIALGADAAGIAKPLLKAANHSVLAVEDYLQEIIQELKISMFCIGASNIGELKYSHYLRKR
jgi:isopentenyl-diphosphate delta-isomerase